MTTKAADLTPFFELAIKNITSFGDTDIFPLPFENHVLFDQKDKLTALLIEAFDEFDKIFAQAPPQHIGSLTPVGHTGFRWAAQLDPFWNAFLLGLILAISESIEASRLPKSSNCIFSYRVDLKPGSNKIFNDEVGFRQFLKHSRDLAQDYEYVVITDISDCYSRIPHHQIKNAFQQIRIAPDISSCIRRARPGCHTALGVIAGFARPANASQVQRQGVAPHGRHRPLVLSASLIAANSHGFSPPYRHIDSIAVPTAP